MHQSKIVTVANLLEGFGNAIADAHAEGTNPVIHAAFADGAITVSATTINPWGPATYWIHVTTDGFDMVTCNGDQSDIPVTGTGLVWRTNDVQMLCELDLFASNQPDLIQALLAAGMPEAMLDHVLGTAQVMGG